MDEKLSQKGFEGMATGVRSIVMTGDSREVPHIMHVVNPTTCETFELLLTMVGRKPLCLRCRREGHFRRNCTTPFCRGLRRDRSGDASEESLPVVGTATECCHTAPDITAVRATRHNSSIGLLEGIQHYRADWISPLHG